MCDTYTRREIFSLTNGATFTPRLNLKNVIGFRLLKVVCNNSFYNVITGVNDAFEFVSTDTGLQYLVYIPGGKYDYTSFATAWQTAANAVGAETFTITYNVDTKKYVIATTNLVAFLWKSGTKTASNISRIAGFYNDTSANENFTTGHQSNYPAQLIPSHYLIKSRALGNGRKSVNGGGGGTQITTPYITTSPQEYISVIPNQVDGSLSTFVYRAPDNDTEAFTYNGLRTIADIDITIVHPEYPNLASTDPFYSIYQNITYEIEFLCDARGA